MEITISGTQVTITGDRVIGFALNNLVNRFTATTDLTDEWSYQLYVHMVVPNLYNIINLNFLGPTTIIVTGSDSYLSMGMVKLYINEEMKYRNGTYNYEAGQEVSVHVISRSDITINGESKGKDVNFDATGLEVTINVGNIVNITY